MKNYFLVTLVIIGLFSFTGCKKYRKGCREDKETIQGVTTYHCDPINDMDGFSEAKGVEIYSILSTPDHLKWYVLWEDESCASLGYKEKQSGFVFYNKDGEDTPGKNSYWASNNPDPNNPNTFAFCTGYVSPCTDPQVNPFCETAYNYRCMYGLNYDDVHVTEPCSTYEGFQELNPAISDCRYCQP